MKPDNSPYAVLDRKEILEVLFYPRKELHEPARHPNYLILIPSMIFVSGRQVVYCGRIGADTAVFHGNGEIVPITTNWQWSTGRWVSDFCPSIIAVTENHQKADGKRDDARRIRFLIYTLVPQQAQAYCPLYIMGRSLGSASALEIASKYTEFIKGLIIESGFARINPVADYGRRYRLSGAE